MGKDNHFLRGAAIGALLASVATLLLAPKSGKKTRADVQKLVSSLTKRLSKQLDQLTEVSKEAYDELVGKTVAEYARGKRLTKEFIDEVTGILKGSWKDIQKEIKKK